MQKILIVLCPNALTKKWKDELLNKFDVKADIMKADNLLDFLNSNNNIQRGGAIICAMQSIRPDKGWDDDEVETKRENKSWLINYLN